MRPRARHLSPIAIVLVLAALPAQAQTSGFVLGEGPGKLVDALIAAGYGSSSLYNALVNIQNNTNPAVTGVITLAFLATLQSCPYPGSPIFATTLAAVKPPAAPPCAAPTSRKWSV
jgi:hypothetical protein